METRRPHRPALVRLALALASIASLDLPATAAGLPPIAEYTRAFEKRDGLFPLHWDAEKGRLLLELPNPGEDFLYLTSLATGLGDIQVSLNLDRGTPGEEALARFERVGPRVQLVVRNSRFRALTGNEHLSRSVEESFATSTLGSFEVVAQDSGAQGRPGRVLIDATSLFLADVIDVRRILREGGQGSYQLDRERSRIHLSRTRGFPENTEVEAALTFTSDEPGQRVRQHVPDARFLTLRQHHSFVRLPDDGYRPRAYDPRIGVFPVWFYDFARPFHLDPVTRYVIRHRLVRKDASAAPSEPVKPIVYYLDPAVPEPYRAAFKEGASWWRQVFEQAGFRNAFRIEDMPAEMDPMDARYHVIQWLHRSESGSSVGPSFVDPRTGEIIKAAVRMDSHRSLANFDLYAALLPALGKDAARLDAEAEAFLMARRRQHAAHEVGHTLGFAHNFIAAFDGRTSVMAYPAPLIQLVDGRLDLSQAYAPGPGAYDSLVLRYAYAQFKPDEEQQGLAAILDEMKARDLRFTTNPHEGTDSSYPEASTWVNGRDAVEELARVKAVRRFILDRFDERAIRRGEAMSTLARRFAQAYLYHGYTLSAAVKAVGGMEFRYGVRGDEQPVTRLIAPARQRRALELVLDCLEPVELAIPDRVQVLLAPTAFGQRRDEHALASAAGTAFDPLGAARALAWSALGQLLSPQRAARIAAFASREGGLPSLEEVVGRVVERTWGAPSPPSPPSHAALRRVVQRAAMDALIELASSKEATPEARAGAEWGLRRILASTRAPAPAGAAAASRGEAAYRALARADVERFLERREAPAPRSDPASLPRRLSLGDGECAWGAQ